MHYMVAAAPSCTPDDLIHVWLLMVSTMTVLLPDA